MINGTYCLQQSLKTFRNTTPNEGKHSDIAEKYTYMGECLIRKQQFVEALSYLKKTREIYQTQINWEQDSYLATTLNIMGIC